MSGLAGQGALGKRPPHAPAGVGEPGGCSAVTAGVPARAARRALRPHEPGRSGRPTDSGSGRSTRPDPDRSRDRGPPVDPTEVRPVDDPVGPGRTGKGRSDGVIASRTMLRLDGRTRLSLATKRGGKPTPHLQGPGGVRSRIGRVIR
ncbi:hypothetical protein NL676_033881 [Syzygium grande]|nr:hypothetical protein NL676_033881 [Syzygium grande]